MNRQEFLRKVKSHGIILVFVKIGKGSHEWWKHEATGERFLIPYKLAHRNVKNALSDISRRTDSSLT